MSGAVPAPPVLFLDLAGVLLDTATAPGRPPGLRAGAGAALRLLERRDYRIIALGPCIHERRQRDGVRMPWPARLTDLLARERVVLHGCMECDETGAACTACPPAPGMLLRAARAHGVALPAAWLLAAGPQQLAAGQQAGCRTMLIDAHTDWTMRAPVTSKGPPAWVARDVFDAALAIVRLDGRA